MAENSTMAKCGNGKKKKNHYSSKLKVYDIHLILAMSFESLKINQSQMERGNRMIYLTYPIFLQKTRLSMAHR